MKKIGLLALVLVFALGALGVGYAETFGDGEQLVIDGTVNTGELDVEFICQTSNDAPGGDCTIDPCECGYWTYCDDEDWYGDRRDDNGNYASTTVVRDTSDTENQTLTVTVTDGYEGYFSSVAFVIENTGTAPAYIDAVNITPSGFTLGTELNVTVEVDEDCCMGDGDTILGAICIEVLEDAEELQTDAYTFTVTIDFTVCDCEDCASGDCYDYWD